MTTQKIMVTSILISDEEARAIVAAYDDPAALALFDQICADIKAFELQNVPAITAPSTITPVTLAPAAPGTLSFKADDLCNSST